MFSLTDRAPLAALVPRGCGAAATLGDLFAFDPPMSSESLPAWTDLTPLCAGAAPAPRYSPTLAAAAGKLYLFGGQTLSGAPVILTPASRAHCVMEAFGARVAAYQHAAMLAGERSGTGCSIVAARDVRQDDTVSLADVIHCLRRGGE